MKINSNKGITLIALTITIIVMVILAGVTINALIGEEGIIKQALNAKDGYNISQIKEKIELYEMGRKTEQYMSSSGNNNSKLPEGITGEYGTYISDDGHIFYVEDLEGEVKYLGKVNEAEIKELEDFLKTKTFEDIMLSEEYLGILNSYEEGLKTIYECFMKYNEKIYKVNLTLGVGSGESIVIEDVKAKYIYAPQGLEGKKVEYTYKVNLENIKKIGEAAVEVLQLFKIPANKYEDINEKDCVLTNKYIILYDDGEYVEMVLCDEDNSEVGYKFQNIQGYNSKILEIQETNQLLTDYFIDEEYNPVIFGRVLGSRYKNAIDTEFHTQDEARLLYHGEKIGYNNRFWLSNYFSHMDGDGINEINNFRFVENGNLSMGEIGREDFEGTILNLYKIKKSLIEDKIID